jgi:prophage antirepressor-like protein
VSALDIFTYSSQQVRTVTIDGDRRIVVADIARILGYRDAANAARSLREQHKGYSIVSTPSGEQNMLTTNAAGFNRLVLRSSASNAEAVQDWVTDEVLTSIAKTGSYSAAPALTEDQIVQQALTILVAKTTALTAKVAELEPVAAESMTYRQSQGLRTIQDLANDLRTHVLSNLDGVRVIQSDVYEHAGRLGLIIRGDTVRNNQPTAQAINAGWVKPARKEIEHNDGSTSTKQYTRLTPKGGARLWDGCLNYIAEHGTLTVQKAVA